ncbi:hypothetical protein KSP39_PZI001282 [Platanthera zijinensis]|uniref:Uncharacterized protein n=1 Tax=Platanthera zijinensis TaxID=2320716 RepID=A0AAP0GFA5_9ASPA
MNRATTIDCFRTRTTQSICRRRREQNSREQQRLETTSRSSSTLRETSVLVFLSLATETADPDLRLFGSAGDEQRENLQQPVPSSTMIGKADKTTGGEFPATDLERRGVSCDGIGSVPVQRLEDGTIRSVCWGGAGNTAVVQGAIDLEAKLLFP